MPYLLDACQAVGQIPVDVQVLNCDMLTATGRKFLRGPRGTGFLYMRAGFMANIELYTLYHSAVAWEAPDRYRVRDDARRFESWESSCGARLGLSVTVDYALSQGLAAIAERNAWLAGLLRGGLADIPDAQVYDLGQTPCAIVSFALERYTAADVAARALEAAIAISMSAPRPAPCWTHNAGRYRHCCERRRIISIPKKISRA